MNKIYLSIGLLLTGQGFTQEQEASNQAIFKKTSPLLETKASYFFFADSDMNKVYQNGGYQLQLSGSYPIWKGLQAYASAGFSEARGHSRSFHQDTSLWQLSIDLGLKPVFAFASFFQYYIALGPRYFYANQHNNSSYVNRTVVKNGAGLFTNTGFNFFPMPHLVIDVFGEYAYQPIHSSSDKDIYRRSVQLSFFSFGAGIGYSF
ncbi:MAG: hypothetical protein JSS09_00255 [Verrucomicrobia bacterium]|nr:hypothetical protein [Verrucomicrobiota bacterium]